MTLARYDRERETPKSGDDNENSVTHGASEGSGMKKKKKRPPINNFSFSIFINFSFSSPLVGVRAPSRFVRQFG